MRVESTPCWRLARITVHCATAFLVLAVASAARAGDDKGAIPAAYQGTWLFRLTSDDSGKTYRSGDNKPICEVSAKEVKFVRKVAFSDEKLTVKSVTAMEAAGRTTYLVRFDNGKAWTLSENSGSITAIIQDGDEGKLKETYRITVRKQMK